MVHTYYDIFCFSQFLRLNERIAGATGLAFNGQFLKIYKQSLNLYQVMSHAICSSVQQHGAQAIKVHCVKLMRNIKRDTLRLISTYLNTSINRDPAHRALTERHYTEFGTSVDRVEGEIAAMLIPPLLHPVIKDYQDNPPNSRDAEVLDLLTTLVTQVRENFFRRNEPGVMCCRMLQVGCYVVVNGGGMK